MNISEEELKALHDFKTLPDSDEIRYKEIIKKKLLDNNQIIYLLNNKDLLDAGCEADEYYGVNILPYYMIHPTQTNVQNFICYEVQFDEVERYNDVIKYGQIIFYVLCEQKNLIDENTYIARHDLLAALLLREFNWTNYFGKKIHCISNKPSVVDSDYACRTLIFQNKDYNDIVKTKNGQRPSIINKEIHI